MKYSTEQNAKLDLWLEQSRACHWWWPYKGIVLASERHTTLNVDERGRLHSLTGLAAGYSDGWGVHAVHGVRVPAYVVESPSSITVSDIESEGNAEVRRIKIDRYGEARFLLDSGSKKIHSDDFGTLYRKDIPSDEPLVMVKVVNATPEPCEICQLPKIQLWLTDDQPAPKCQCVNSPDVYKDYFLRVPPDMHRARQAVAWTFGKEEEAYAPSIET